MNSIAITSIPNIRIGQVEDEAAGTGVTVIVAPKGAIASIDVRGGGPASRDTRILDPLAAAERINAIVLGGGSAYGLDAAGGVMRALRERGLGLTVMPDFVVPLVCQSDIFDLGVGRADVFPSPEMGYAACNAAFEGTAGNYRDGNYGAGCGASVGKLAGQHLAMKSGIGSAAVRVGDLYLGALVVVNACGDIYDSSTGTKIAGTRTDASYQELMYAALEQEKTEDTQTPRDAAMATNTSIGAIITNAAFTKAQLCKLAGMAHDAYARAIRPVHTSMDGDSIYGVSVGDVEASLDVVGTLAADLMEQAILRACYSADSAYGLPSAKRELQ